MKPIVCCMLFASLCASVLSARVFTDNQGRSINATLVNVENETITLKLDQSGIIYNIGISQLCAADQEYIQKLLAEKNKVSFERDVLPILQEKCFRCHSERAEKVKGGLMLNTKKLINKGGDSEGLIVAGDPEVSLLYELMALEEGDEDLMPPEAKGDPASEKQLDIIATWIREGADFGDWTEVDQSDTAQYALKVPKGKSPLAIEQYGKNKFNKGLDLSEFPENPMRLGQAEVRTFAKRIDNLVNEYRKNRGVETPKGIDDSTYVRRIYLDVIGRIPTQSERELFLNSDDPYKREKLVNYLLNTEGYTQNYFQFWADAFRVLMIDRGARNLGEVYYANWLKDVIRRNVPYDQIAHDCISAVGMPHQNGAVGYLARDRNMPADHMANTVQLFLGTQLQCAQCHDHPFDKWNRKDFLGMEAFYAATSWGSRPYITEKKRKNKNSAEAMASMAPMDSMMSSADTMSAEDTQAAAEAMAAERALRKASLALRYTYFTDSIWEPNLERRQKLPKDYQYKDGQPNDRIDARVLEGDQPVIDQSPRRAFAKWVTSAENPFFAKVLGNRLWKKVMGIGLIEPVDEMTYATESNMPGLLNELEYQLKSVNYNLKDFLRILYSTQTFQMATMREDLPEDYMDYHYSGRPLQRMTGAQLWDSLLALAVQDIDERKGYGHSVMDPKFRQIQDSMVAARPQMMDPKVHQPYLAAARQYINPYKNYYKQVLKSKGPQNYLGGTKASNSLTYWHEDSLKDERWVDVHHSLVRATELRSPADEFHLVRQFGQSDRKTIGAGRTDGSITQALTLLNGPIHELLSSDESEIAKLMKDYQGPAKWTFLFQSVLGRDPMPEDFSVISRMEAKVGESDAERSVLWALLNTREFIYIR